MPFSSRPPPPLPPPLPPLFCSLPPNLIRRRRRRRPRLLYMARSLPPFQTITITKMREFEKEMEVFRKFCSQSANADHGDGPFTAHVRETFRYAGFLPTQPSEWLQATDGGNPTSWTDATTIYFNPWMREQRLAHARRSSGKHKISRGAANTFKDGQSRRVDVFAAKFADLGPKGSKQRQLELNRCGGESGGRETP